MKYDLLHEKGEIDKFKDYSLSIKSGKVNRSTSALEVSISLSNGDQYHATFLTLDQLNDLFTRNHQTGDFSNGSYYTLPRMIIVKDIDEGTIRNTIDSLIEKREISSYFRK